MTLIRNAVFVCILLLCGYSQKGLSQVLTCSDPIVNINFGTTHSPTAISFSTNYTRATNRPNDNEYAISNNSGIFNGNAFNPWHDEIDHTSGDVDGLMMIVNAANEPGEFYRQNITGLCPNITYEFSAWVGNIINPHSACSKSRQYPNVLFEIRNLQNNALIVSVTTGNILESSSGINWVRGLCSFTVNGTLSSVVLVIKNQAPGGCGNDLVLDDILFRPCGVLNITTASNFTQLNGNLLSTCESQPVALNVQTANLGNSIAYQWQYSTDSGTTWNNFTFPPEQSTYTISNNTAPSPYNAYRAIIATNNDLTDNRCKISTSPLIYKTIAIPTISISTTVNNDIQTLSNDGLRKLCKTWRLDFLTAITASNLSDYTLLWQSKSNNDWIDKEIAIIPYNKTVISVDETYDLKYYRLKATRLEEPYCFQNSTEIQLNIIVPPELTLLTGINNGALTKNVAATICPDIKINFQSQTSGTTNNCLFQWQYSDGATWINEPITSLPFQKMILKPSANDTKQYRLYTINNTNPACFNYSNITSITVKRKPSYTLSMGVNNDKLIQSDKIQLCENDKINLVTILNDNVNVYQYQWQSSSDNELWHTFSEQNTNTYLIGSAKKEDSKYYRVVASETNLIEPRCNFLTNTTQLDVQKTPSLVLSINNQTNTIVSICMNDKVQFSSTFDELTSKYEFSFQTNNGDFINWIDTQINYPIDYHIATIQAADAKIYRILAQEKENIYPSCGNVLSNNIELRTLILPPIGLTTSTIPNVCNQNVIFNLNNMIQPLGGTFTSKYLLNNIYFSAKDALIGKNEVTYRIKHANYDCYNQITCTINVVTPPIFHVESSNNNFEIVPGIVDSLELRIIGVEKSILKSIRWQPNQWLSSDSSISIITKPKNPIIYTVDIVDNNDCRGQQSFDILINGGILNPKNTFSPNGDGMNDLWEIDFIQANLAYQDCEVSVFNRYGEEVFHSKGYLMPWDGKYNNKLLPIGTYYYIIKSKSAKNNLYAGSLTIIY